MEKLIRIKLYFTSGYSVEYHTKEYSDGNSELCFWQGKTEISVNLKNIACIEIEDVEAPSKEEENKSDVKDEFEPGYVYYTCPKEDCVYNHGMGMYRVPNPLTKNLSYDEEKKRKADLIFKKCPRCRTQLILLYV